MMYEEKLVDVIAQRKHERMVSIPCEIALSETLDQRFCEATTKALQSGERYWECRVATPNLSQTLPNSAGVYMFVYLPPFSFHLAKDPKKPLPLLYPLYVGKAGADSSLGTIRSRYHSEYRKYVGQNPELLWSIPQRRRSELLKTYLNVYPLEFWYLEVLNTSAINRLESSLIKILNPPLNVQGTIKARPSGPPAPAFKTPS